MKFLRKLPIFILAFAAGATTAWLQTQQSSLLNRVRSYATTVFSAHKNQYHPNYQAAGILFEQCFTPQAQQEREQYAVEVINSTEQAPYSKLNAANNEPGIIKVNGQEKEIAACRVARRIIIRPELPQRILFVCVHGTNSSAKSYGGVDGRPLSQELKNFAIHLSQHFNCGVEMLPFSWSGSLKGTARYTAGAALAQTLQKTINQADSSVQYTQVWTFGHSHGCNVVNIMASTLKNTLQEKSLPITSVHIASPIVKSEVVHAVHLDHCYHFYGAHDATQAFGSMLASHNPARKIEYPNVTNICIMDSAKNLDHKKIKIPVVKYLPKLLYTIDKEYRPCTDLIASTPKEGTAHTFVCIKDHKKVRPNSDQHDVQKAQQFASEQEEQFKKTFNQQINQPLNKRQRAVNFVQSARTELFAKPD